VAKAQGSTRRVQSPSDGAIVHCCCAVVHLSHIAYYTYSTGLNSVPMTFHPFSVIQGLMFLL
jgi:hypothetical protein